MRVLKKIFSTLFSIIILLAILSPLSYSYEIYDSSIYLTQDIQKPINRLYTPNLLEMIKQVNESTLENHIQTIQDFGPHPTGSIELEEVKEYLYQQLTEYDLSVDLKPWNYKFKSGYNVEATLPGIGSNTGIVIICAHYDSVAVSPGADDDGSGVVSVLTIAEIMSKAEFNSTIKFVLFSGEEQGLYGSHKNAE
jgi:acetylornithine deacetylase/succinyl-diaminopimelate desuccinylase-like protein